MKIDSFFVNVTAVESPARQGLWAIFDFLANITTAILSLYAPTFTVRHETLGVRNHNLK